MDEAEEWTPFLRKLESEGFGVQESSPDYALVSAPGGGGVDLIRVGGWLQASAIIASASEISAGGFRSAVSELAMLIHNYFIQCRFAIGASGDLLVVHDIFPGVQSAVEVADALQHVCWVGVTMMPLFEGAIKTGEIPSDFTIESTFRNAE